MIIDENLIYNEIEKKVIKEDLEKEKCPDDCKNKDIECMKCIDYSHFKKLK